MEPKTAAALTPEDILRFREHSKSRQDSAKARDRSRLDKAHQVARRAANLLKAEFSAQRVVAFGSLVDEELFHQRSDIDLAVWGIDEQNYYRAVGVLQSLDPQFSIDLIEFEHASADLQQIILRLGLEL